jgi:hypothetical protein
MNEVGARQGLDADAPPKFPTKAPPALALHRRKNVIKYYSNNYLLNK